MPVSRLLTLAGLFGLCLAIVGIAWANGAELYLFIPSRRQHPPPTHPSVILVYIVASVPLTYWLRQIGVWFFAALTGGIAVGTILGYCVFHWTPSWAQHVLFVAMIVTSIYAWNQKDYFED